MTLITEVFPFDRDCELVKYALRFQLMPSVSEVPNPSAVSR
jgi:hypothetical protein